MSVGLWTPDLLLSKVPEFIVRFYCFLSFDVLPLSVRYLFQNKSFSILFVKTHRLVFFCWISYDFSYFPVVKRSLHLPATLTSSMPQTFLLLLCFFFANYYFFYANDANKKLYNFILFFKLSTEYLRVSRQLLIRRPLVNAFCFASTSI